MSAAEEIKALITEGKHEAAIAMMVASQPEMLSDDQLHHLGLLALKLRQPSLALKFTSPLYQRRPADVQVMNNHGVALLECNKDDEALELFEKMFQINPQSSKARFNQAMIYDRQNNLEKAKKLYEEVVEIDPALGQTYSRLALIAQRENDLDALEKWAKKALEVSISDSQAHYASAFHHLRSGQLQAAYDATQKAIALNPNEAPYYFLRGQLLEKRGEFQAAYESFEKGNSFFPKREDVKAKVIRDVDGLLAMLKTNERPQKRNPLDPKLPIFILGHVRSGTTLVASILGSHEKLANGGETGLFDKVFARAIGLFGCESSLVAVYQELSKEENKKKNEKLREYFDQEVAAFKSKNNFEGKRLVDKSPMNTLFAPLIARLFPKAPLIHLVRDGREVALSTFKQNFSAYHWYKYNLAESLLNWMMAVSVVSQTTRFLPNPGFNLRYEDFVQRPHDCVRQLTSFLGLDYDEDMLENYRKGKPALTASYEQVNRPIYSDALFHCRDHYPNHYASMTQLAKDVLGQWGYL